MAGMRKMESRRGMLKSIRSNARCIRINSPWTFKNRGSVCAVARKIVDRCAAAAATAAARSLEEAVLLSNIDDFAMTYAGEWKTNSRWYYRKLQRQPMSIEAPA